MSISTRELLMLGDHLSIHATMAEKAGFYATQVTDPQIRQVLTQLQRGHQRHVDSIVQHIESATVSGFSMAQAATAAASQYAGGASASQSQYAGPIQQFQV